MQGPVSLQWFPTGQRHTGVIQGHSAPMGHSHGPVGSFRGSPHTSCTALHSCLGFHLQTRAPQSPYIRLQTPRHVCQATTLQVRPASRRVQHVEHQLTGWDATEEEQQRWVS